MGQTPDNGETENFSFFAETPEALLANLRRTDITVPNRMEDTTTQHRERYMMARFLATKAKSACIPYPMFVQHLDKPDFVLRGNGLQIGVECIEVVPEEWYEIEAIRGRQFPQALTFGQIFKPGKKIFTKQEKLDIASGTLAGPPWAGNMPQRYWAEAMEYFIQVKTEKLRSGSYRGFSPLWLLIQDEWRVPLYDLKDLREAAEMCLSRIAYLQESPCFEAIFACSREWLLSFEKDALTIDVIPRLWGTIKQGMNR
jgi:hypothetical protein